MKRFLLLLLYAFAFQISLAQNRTRPGLHTGKINWDGLERQYRYYLPASFDAKQKLPIVFFLHGMGASAQIAVNVLGPQFHARAERDGAIVVYPEASSKHWNDKLGGSYPATDTVDDVGYIASLIDLFVSDFKADPGRVYISGSSNGGMMTYRLSVDIPEKITALAPFISAISPQVARQFAKAKPLPIIVTSGTADTIIRWNGGPVRVTRTPSLLSGDENIAYWRIRNQLKGDAQITRLPDAEPEDGSTVEKHEYKGKFPVVLYKIINGAHQHPTLREKGQSLVPGRNMDYNSFETVWDFMMSFKK